jgi:uncharacterized protein YecE (DUF72 family)
MRKVFIGTAGWSYKDWIGSFYVKPQSKKYDHLQHYAYYFNAVEINSTYYGYPKKETVHNWINKVSHMENFIFEIKLHQDFTHLRNFNGSNVRAVRENLDILKDAGRLGSLLIQFPYSFHMDQNNISYLSKLVELFTGYKRVVEVRHNSWANEKALELFNEHELTLCSIDQPQVGKSLKFDVTVSDKRVYLRLHGRNKGEWFKNVNKFKMTQTAEEKNARYDYKYSLGELNEIKLMIEEKYGEIEEIHIIFNNHPNGKSVINALELNALLDHQVYDDMKKDLVLFPIFENVVLN